MHTEIKTSYIFQLMILSENNYSLFLHKTCQCPSLQPTSVKRALPHCSCLSMALHFWAQNIEGSSNKAIPELQIREGTEDNSKRFFFIFLNENICCDHSLEPSLRNGSNDGSQNMFL